MKHNEKYHLWLGHYDSMEEYDKYIDIDGTTQTSQLAIDLGFPYRDKELDEVYGLTCLQPDFRYSFPPFRVVFRYARFGKRHRKHRRYLPPIFRQTAQYLSISI